MAASKLDTEIDSFAEMLRSQFHPQDRPVASARLLEMPRFGLVSSATITASLAVPMVAVLTGRHLMLARFASGFWSGRIIEPIGLELDVAREQVRVTRTLTSLMWLRVQLDVPHEDRRFFLRAQLPQRSRTRALLNQLGPGRA